MGKEFICQDLCTTVVVSGEDASENDRSISVSVPIYPLKVASLYKDNHTKIMLTIIIAAKPINPLWVY